MFKSVIIRFLKGVVSGGVASMGVVTFTQPHVWSDFSTILSSLGIAAGYGCLVGALLGLQKLASWQE